MTAIVTADDLDPVTLPIIGSKVVANDPTKAPNVLEGFNPDNPVPVQNGDDVETALGKLQAQVSEAAAGGNTLVSYMNASSSSLNPGAPVYLSNPGSVLPALGALVGRRVIALYADPTSLAPTGVGNFLVEGSLTLTAPQWQQVTGFAGGLQPGQRYFLDLNTPGVLRAAVSAEGAPTNSYLVPVGYALSTTEFVLDIGAVIRLA